MVLSQEQGEKIINLIGEKWIRQGCCPMCNHSGLSIENRIYELREFNNGNVVIGGNQATIPVAVIICPECGNTMFINVLAAGVINQNSNIENN